MKSHEKKRLDDLEKRVRELEARPFWPTATYIIVQPAPQAPVALPLGQFYVGDPIPWTVPVPVSPTRTVQPFLAPGTFV